MTRLFVLTSLVLSLTACSTSTDEPSRVDDPASASDAGGAGNKGGPAVATGVPCDVAAVLSQHCATCHGNPTAFGAPFSLVTNDDLGALKDGKRRLELALSRVHDDAAWSLRCRVYTTTRARCRPPPTRA